MKKPLVSQYQEISAVEANRISTLGDRRVFDHVLRRLIYKPTGVKVPDGESVYFGDDCKVTYVSGDRAVGCTFQIAAGLGFRKFSTGDQPDANRPEFAPISVLTAFTQLASPSDPTNPRIDRIFLKPNPNVTGDTASRNFINPGTGTVSAAPTPTTEAYTYTLAYVAGTPAGSPSAPAAPTGFTANDCIAEFRINAGAGTFDTALLTDFRTKALIAGDVQGAFTTGDWKGTVKSVADPGWVLLNDGTIGKSGSSATNRANDDTFPLFALLWTLNATYFPLSGGRGASAAADFAAGKLMQLGRVAGRALAAAGTGSGLTARTLGVFTGEEEHVMLPSELPPHAHGVSTSFSGLAGAAGANVPWGAAAGAAWMTDNGPGVSDPMNVMQPTWFSNVMMKL